MRSGPVLRDGTRTSRYDMNMTGYSELSVTPLSLQTASSATNEDAPQRSLVSVKHAGTAQMNQCQGLA